MAPLLQTWSPLLDFVLLSVCIQSFEMRRCVYKERPHKVQFHKYGYVNGSVQYCNFTKCCVSFYLITGDRELEVDRQACYLEDKTCSKFSCLHFKNLLRCVCNGDLCNNVTSWTTEVEKPMLLSYSNDGILVAGLVVLLLALLLAVIILKIICNKTKNPHSPPSPLCAAKSSEMLDVELHKVLCTGGFATVWEGRHQGAQVAVKVYPSASKHMFAAEREVHQLLSTVHPNIIQFCGFSSFKECGAIILEYAAHGSLHSYLSEHSFSWTSSLNLCLSLSQGLSYLHEPGVHRPAIAHGDLSSSNVLVKVDGTCALCDFGCSTFLPSDSGNHQLGSHHSRPSQTICKKGTLRYMSPEILEGLVLLQAPWQLWADIYSLGLVLWEVWMRCLDLFGERVPLHLLPYERELGANVSLERLVQHVAVLELRPTIPDVWLQHPKGATLAELLDHCWDTDTEARVSASYVVDTLASFQSFTTED